MVERRIYRVRTEKIITISLKKKHLKKRSLRNLHKITDNNEP
jgi:hypothetical protein